MDLNADPDIYLCLIVVILQSEDMKWLVKFMAHCEYSDSDPCYSLERITLYNQTARWRRWPRDPNATMPLPFP